MELNPPAADDQDARDMARLAQGGDAALNQLMERHGERLFHYLLRSLQDEEDAADLAQETFTRVYQNRAKFDTKQKFSTWLYAIASNLVRDRYRWRVRHPQISMDAEKGETGTTGLQQLADTHADPSQDLQGLERAEQVRSAVGALGEEIRVPLILAEYEGRSYAEIGEILGCTPKAVETRIYRARQQLRVTLAGLIAQT